IEPGSPEWKVGTVPTTPQRRTESCQQHVVFPMIGREPVFSTRDRTRTGIFNMVWPITMDGWIYIYIYIYIYHHHHEQIRFRPCGLLGILECQFWKSISCHSSQMIFPFLL
ncbi:hypothetical protein L9F63_001689, partial [Diploptera punctata]